MKTIWFLNYNCLKSFKRKILLAINAEEAKTSAIDFGCRIANLFQKNILINIVAPYDLSQ